MTVCRKGPASDVHVDRGARLCLVCRGCIMWADQKDLEIEEAEDMAQHLRDHARMGHKVPPYALRIDRLDAEISGGFDWSFLFWEEEEDERARTTSDRMPYVDHLHRVVSGLLTRLSAEQKARNAWYEEAKRWQSLYLATLKPKDPFPKVIESDGSCDTVGCEAKPDECPMMSSDGWYVGFFCQKHGEGLEESKMVWWKDASGKIHPPKTKP